MDRDEQIFLAALTQANQELGRYVLRMLDESTNLGVTDYTRPLPDLEQKLGSILLRLGRQLVDRSERRGVSVVQATSYRADVSDRTAGITGRCAPEAPQ